MMTIHQIAELIQDVPDFPKPGILFKDITPILDNPEAFRSLAKIFAAQLDPDTEKLIAIESRGFILGSAVVQHFNAGLELVRKPGKLPRKTIQYSYELEYGKDTLEMHQDSIKKGQKVAIIDDVLATGGTARATGELIKQLGGEITGLHCLLEIEFLKGRDTLDFPTYSLIQC